MNKIISTAALIGLLACGGGLDTHTTTPVALSIKSQPTSQMVIPSQQATFQVVAEGTPDNIGYQWQQFNGANWTDLSGGNSSSFNIVAAESDHGSQFRCRVSNGPLTRFSEPGVLLVSSVYSVSLPPVIYATEGYECRVRFENMLCSQTPNNFSFTVSCDLGVADASSWVVVPASSQVGDHVYKVRVVDSKGPEVTVTSILRVTQAQSPNLSKPARILIIGDSITSAGIYAADLASMLSGPGNPSWEMIGRLRIGAFPGCGVEATPGVTWSWYAQHVRSGPSDPLGDTSPFLVVDTIGAHLDLGPYLLANATAPPDLVIIALGVNDCFSADPTLLAGIDQRISSMFGYSDMVVAAIQKAAPTADIGIALALPGNIRESAFLYKYGPKYTAWGWQRIQRRLVTRQIEHWQNRETERLFVIPWNLVVDTFNGFPDNNAVHPNGLGHHQMSIPIYAWVKSRLATW